MSKRNLYARVVETGKLLYIDIGIDCEILAVGVNPDIVALAGLALEGHFV